MAAWRKEEVYAASPGEERNNETGKLVIADGSVEFCEATPIGLVDEPKVSLYGRETDRDLRSEIFKWGDGAHIIANINKCISM